MRIVFRIQSHEVFLCIVAAVDLLLQHRHCHVDTLVSKNSWPLLAPRFCVHVRILSPRNMRLRIRGTSLIPLYEELQCIFSQLTTRALPSVLEELEYRGSFHIMHSRECKNFRGCNMPITVVDCFFSEEMYIFAA